MDKLEIIGKEKIFGSLNISGAKNAALPLMVASLLSDNGLCLSNLPDLQDITTMKHLLENFHFYVSTISFFYWKNQIYLFQKLNNNYRFENFQNMLNKQN